MRYKIVLNEVRLSSKIQFTGASAFLECTPLRGFILSVTLSRMTCIRFQQKPNNRILLLPSINSSQAQKVRLLDFWPSDHEDTTYFSERNLERTYSEMIRFIF